MTEEGDNGRKIDAVSRVTDVPVVYSVTGPTYSGMRIHTGVQTGRCHDNKFLNSDRRPLSTLHDAPRLQWGGGDGGEKGWNGGSSEGNDREGSQRDLEPSTLPITGPVRPRRVWNGGIAAARRGTSSPFSTASPRRQPRVALLALNIPYFSWQFLRANL